MPSIRKAYLTVIDNYGQSDLFSNVNCIILITCDTNESIINIQKSLRFLKMRNIQRRMLLFNQNFRLNI